VIPSYLDPTQFTALHSLTLGDVLSPDGRAHPLDAHTPVVFTQVPATIVPGDARSTGPVAPVGGQDPRVPYIGMPGDGAQPGAVDTSPSAAMAALGGLLPKHFGARFVVAFIAAIIVIIVAARLIL
jgi:hypothetical protein